MKFLWIFVILLFKSCATNPVDNPSTPDKLDHFTYSMAAAAGASKAIGPGGCKGPVIGFTVVTTLGAVKELQDSLSGGYFSWYDLAADMSGAFIGSAVAGCNPWITY